LHLPIKTPLIPYKYKKRTIKKDITNPNNNMYHILIGTNSITIIAPINPRITPRIFLITTFLRSIKITP
jgi:hypothetical protein